MPSGLRDLGEEPHQVVRLIACTEEKKGLVARNNMRTTEDIYNYRTEKRRKTGGNWFEKRKKETSEQTKCEIRNMDSRTLEK